MSVLLGLVRRPNRFEETRSSPISGTEVVDAKSVRDIAKKRALNSAAFGLRDKRISLEITCLLEPVEQLQTEVRWVHSEVQLAEGLTKPLRACVLCKVLFMKSRP